MRVIFHGKILCHPYGSLLQILWQSFECVVSWQRVRINQLFAVLQGQLSSLDFGI